MKSKLSVRWLVAAAITTVVLIGALNVLALGRYPAIGGDEVYFSPTAYSFLMTGKFARITQPGPAGFQIRDYFPPTITLLMSASYALFGFGVWQTKIVTLLAGAISTFLVYFLTFRLTASLEAALLGSAVFVFNPEAFTSWQTGRYEAVLILAILLILFLAYVGCRALPTDSPRGWFAIGVMSGIMAITYYPFATSGALIVAAVWIERVGARASFVTRQKIRLTVSAFIGASIVLLLFGLNVSAHPDLFERQVLSQIGTYTGASSGLMGIIHTVTDELGRYRAFIVGRLGFFDLMLATLVAILAVQRRSICPPALRVVLVGLLVWPATLIFYGMKDSRYLVLMAPFVAVASGMLWAAARRGELTTRQGRTLATVIAGVIAVGIARYTLIAGTVAYQWSGRDYDELAADLRQAIPPGEDVIGPQSAWYALALHAGSIQLYTQGGKQVDEPSGDAGLNDPAVIAHARYVILGEALSHEERLAGLKTEVRQHFVLRRRIRLPFHPLPWAPTSPFDMDVYVRK